VVLLSCASGMAADSRLSLADVALEENHPDHAETLVRTAIAEYEKEQSNPAAMLFEGGAQLNYQRNLLACKTGSGYCDESLLSPADERDVAFAQRQRNALACGAEDITCDRSCLNVAQAKPER